MIVDQAKVVFQSGSGGQASTACVKLSSGKAIGVGGDGGRGGNVILRVSPHLYDLKSFKGKKKFIASSGQAGSKNNKSGKDADDLIVSVPAGTRVIEQGNIVVDLIKEDDQLLLCRGGLGGLGNFKRNYTKPAKEGERKEVVLDYRILNQVVILGFANSGKTTLFNALTGQNQKVADYPFTTSSCIWAAFEYEFKRFVVMDMPPLSRIRKPTQEGKNIFLRQILRSKLLIFLSDNPRDYKKDFEDILREVKAYDSSLLEEKKFFYLLAKIDTIDRKEDSLKVLPIGTKEGLKSEKLKKIIKEALEDENNSCKNRK